MYGFLQGPEATSPSPWEEIGSRPQMTRAGPRHTSSAGDYTSCYKPSRCNPSRERHTPKTCPEVEPTRMDQSGGGIQQREERVNMKEIGKGKGRDEKDPTRHLVLLTLFQITSHTNSALAFAEPFPSHSSMSSSRQQIGLFTKGLERPGLSKQYQYHPSVKEKPSKARQNQHPRFSPTPDTLKIPVCKTESARPKQY